MTGYTSSHEAMQAGATAVESAQQAIQGHISTLRGEVETMQAGWSGQAASAFANVHQTFEENAGKINQALAQMHEALVSTGQTYNSQESDQSQTFTSMQSNING